MRGSDRAFFIPQEVIMAVNVMSGRLPHVRWSAVFAGAAVALAAHVCLGLFGAALGYGAEAHDSRALGWLAILWSISTAFAASMTGVIVATRMAAESDGDALLHGSLVWCVGLIAGAIFLSGTLTGGTVGAGYAWNGGIISSARDAGPGTAIESAAGSAANASLMAGIASLFGLAGALVGALVGRQWAVVDAHLAAPRPQPDHGMALDDRTRPAAASTLMPPPVPERRTHDETIWSDPAFDRRRSALEDRRHQRH
jgi:hypothetical protein